MPEMQQTAKWLLRRLRSIESLLCISAFCLLAGVIFADVVSRELRGAGFYWATQTGVWANVVVVMAGFGLASASGMHLRPRFADGWLPRSWAPAITRLQHVCMSLFCFGAAALAAGVTFESWQLGEISIELFVPIWPVQIMLPLAFGAAAVRHALYAIWPELAPSEAAVTSDLKGKGSR